MVCNQSIWLEEVKSCRGMAEKLLLESCWGRCEHSNQTADKFSFNVSYFQGDGLFFCFWVVLQKGGCRLQM